MKNYYSDKELMKETYKHIKSVNSVLDIGCGIRPFENISTKIHICCEPYIEYVQILQERYPEKIILNMEWGDVVNYIPHKTIDTILLIDIIEHLEKDIAVKLLLKTLKLVKNQLIIFTPLGFFEQYHDDGIDAWGFHGGEWQRHRSGWLPEDFPQIEGGEWEFYICEDFHKTTATGELLEAPIGAFWAIWNVTENNHVNKQFQDENSKLEAQYMQIEKLININQYLQTQITNLENERLIQKSYIEKQDNAINALETERLMQQTLLSNHINQIEELEEERIRQKTQLIKQIQEIEMLENERIALCNQLKEIKNMLVEFSNQK